MAFIRAYTAQGDPRTRYMRAGMLLRGQRAPRAGAARLVRAQRLQHARLLSAKRGRRGSAARRRMVLAAGDPFRLRMPKFLRKLQIGHALGQVVKAAAPLVGGAFLGPAGASVAAQLTSGIGRNVAPELTTQPASTGPPGAVYTVSGTEVTPATSGQVYNVFERRARVAQEENEDEADVADVGDEEDVGDVDEEESD